MRQVTRKGLITVAAAGGVLALSGGSAIADATASGGADHSPGVGSGNTIQVPVNAPVNVCGNTVDVGGLLNPAFGNTCVNDGESHDGRKDHKGGHKDAESGGKDTEASSRHASDRSGGSTAEGHTDHSPGVLSGNVVQVPVDVPVNVCGNSVNVVGLLNPTFGNDCVNESDAPPKDTPEKPDKEPEKEPNVPETQTVSQPELAETGAGYELETTLGMGASMVLGGAVLYRRARSMQR